MSSSQRAVAATTEPQPADLAGLLKRLPTLRNIYTGDLNTDMLNIYITKKRKPTGLSKKMDGIWNRYNLKSTGRIYTFGILKCSEKFKVLDLP